MRACTSTRRSRRPWPPWRTWTRLTPPTTRRSPPSSPTCATTLRRRRARCSPSCAAPSAPSSSTTSARSWPTARPRRPPTRTRPRRPAARAPRWPGRPPAWSTGSVTSWATVPRTRAPSRFQTGSYRLPKGATESSVGRYAASGTARGLDEGTGQPGTCACRRGAGPDHVTATRRTSEVCPDLVVFDSEFSWRGCAARLPARGGRGGARAAPRAGRAWPGAGLMMLLAGGGRGRPAGRSAGPPRPAAGAASRPQGVADLDPAAGGGVAARGGMVVGDHLLHVGQSPAPGDQVDREQLLLAAHAEPDVEPADLQERRAPDDRPAGDEPEHRRAGQIWNRWQGAVGHLLAHRVEPPVRADQHPGRHHRQPGMAVQQVDGPAEGARGPPGVVVAEGDIGAVDQAGPDGAGRPAAVAPQADHLDARVVGADQLGRAVGGAVVDHHDRGLLVQGAQPGQGAEQLGAAVAGGDDDGDPSGGCGHGLQHSPRPIPRDGSSLRES